MRTAAAVLLGSLLLAAGCSGGGSPSDRQSSGPSPAGSPGAPASFEAYVGAYRADSGVTYALNGHGHLVNLSDGWIRQLFAGPAKDVFTVGPGFQLRSPPEAEVAFHLTRSRGDRMTLTSSAGPALFARRLQFKETEAKVQAQGAVLAATVTEPVTPGPHPGIVLVHGSGLGPRIDYGVWVALYASLGLTVLAYDKRGNGESTGTYPGEFPTTESLATYADDAAACLRFLASWPGIDARRVGFHGGSQGGWTVPLAIQRFPATAFAVLVSGPAVSVGQQGVWASFSGGSRRLPSASAAEMDVALRADHSGYDPGPVLTSTATPIVWINGEVDRQVPTQLNADILRGLGKPNFDVQVLPGVSHGLLENSTGLVQDDEKAQRLARDLFVRIATWLAARVGSNPTP